MWIDQLAEEFGLQVELGAYNSVAGLAVFNEEKNERYMLEKRWARGEKTLLAFLQAPSKASHIATDRTVTQLIELAKLHDCDALHVINLSSIIEDDFTNANKSYQGRNRTFIETAINNSDMIFLGWGQQGQLAAQQMPELKETLLKNKEKLMAYEVIKEPKINFTYVPIPRVKGHYKKYIDQKSRILTKEELGELFV
ncbi:hypothetical protein KZO01_04440 [Kurthia zopfii]|uniref:Uncharacterized protein conserved in bacteria n=1 Tax=Kurthia zopfii TaxID=1650 RepID=A0A8B4QCM7_9BACL|nr:DUF1643 domain-containing protein [Kurthia zopfii]PWI23654.1 hypothetical protein DF281_02130 [Kurthia zopfii]TDR42662.1 hypothetical protein DFR61_10337 [Kurthia zopfii]GEK30135.1 hypothetical protein KZO01_04440 [Kurthia zopfii]STX10501.1 Uncharacterized protein conserved in bacteria [Kurthia zopfii]